MGGHIAVSQPAVLPTPKGVATYRLVRYSDDFVILVNGTREQVDALRAETADLLAATGCACPKPRR